MVVISAFDIQGALIHGQSSQLFQMQRMSTSTGLPHYQQQQQQSCAAAAGSSSRPTKSPKKTKRCSNPMKKASSLSSETGPSSTRTTTGPVGPGSTVPVPAETEAVQNQKTVKVERVESLHVRDERNPDEHFEEDCNISPDFEGDEADDGQEEDEDETGCFRGLMDAGVIHPKDFIITPDICSGTE